MLIFHCLLVYTDASNQGLGAVLTQEQWGVEHVIAYASRSLHPAERNDANYSSFKLELLAMKWAITGKFKDYLWGAKVIVIRYRSGRAHVNADALSRLQGSQTLPKSVPQVAVLQVNVAVVEAPGGHCSDVPSGWGWDPQHWREVQRQDAVLYRVFSFVEAGSLPLRLERSAQPKDVQKLLGQWKRLCLKDGVLCHLRQDSATQEGSTADSRSSDSEAELVRSLPQSNGPSRS